MFEVRPVTAAPHVSAKADKCSERLAAIRLRFGIGSYLDDHGITTPEAIARVTGLLGAEAAGLINRTRVREGDIEALRQVAARLGLVEDPENGHWRPTGPEAA